MYYKPLKYDTSKFHSTYFVGSKKFEDGKTKVMFSCSMKDKVKEKGKWPSGIGKKRVGTNSILCHGCKK